MRAGPLLAYRGAASPIVRLDYLTLDERTKPYGDRHRVLCTPAQAAGLGADAVVMYLMLGAAEGETFADNLAAVGQAVRDAHELGLPLNAEVVAWGLQATDRRDADLLAYGSRLAVEVGADMVKTEYPGDPERMAGLVRGCPALVLVLGGAKADSVDALLATTRDARFTMLDAMLGGI